MVKDLEKGPILKHSSDGPDIVTGVIISERECQENQMGRKRGRDRQMGGSITLLALKQAKGQE